MSRPADPTLILIHQQEKGRALSAGWSRDQIVFPTIRQLEGRRYKKIIITFRANEVIANSAIMDRIATDAILMNTVVELGFPDREPEA